MDIAQHVVTEKGQSVDVDSWFLSATNSAGEKNYISPWHDVDPMVDDRSSIKGVIEMERGATVIKSCALSFEHNPIMQETSVDKSGLLIHKVIEEPALFNYGFVPQTWSDSRWGGDGNPLDLVDLSSGQAKTTLTVCDFKVLGVLGHIDKGMLDYKIIVLDAKEANERGILTLDDLKD